MTLTITQKQTLVAVAYDGSYLYNPHLAAEWQCMLTPTVPPLSPWPPSARSLVALRRKGLIHVADAGSGCWRGSLNKYGREALYSIVAADPEWLHEHPLTHHRRDARQFLAGIVLPPGRPRTIAAIIRDAQQNTKEQSP